MITVIILAMAIAGTGCGAKSNSSEAAQAETTVKEEKEETAKSNKQDINTNDINNSDIDSEDLIQGEGESDTNTTKNEVSNDSAKSSKDASTTTDKKAATVTTGSNTATNNPTTNNTTASKNNSESGKNNDSQQNTSTPTTNSQATHTHTWQHIEATGHYETVVVQSAWDEEVPVYKQLEIAVCNVCNSDLTNLSDEEFAEHQRKHALAYEGSGWHSEVRTEQSGTQIVHHSAVTEQRWVQDSPAYDRCTTCGEVK